MIKNNLLALSFLLSVFIFAQEEVEEIPIEEQRNNKIKELLQTVETNKSIYIQEAVSYTQLRMRPKRIV